MIKLEEHTAMFSVFSAFNGTACSSVEPFCGLALAPSGKLVDRFSKDLAVPSSAFPAISLGFTILGEIFAYMTFFNPTIEVVTFRLHGWCMLGVFLLPAFTRLGHECQDLLSMCDGIHACTD